MRFVFFEKVLKKPSKEREGCLKERKRKHLEIDLRGTLCERGLKNSRKSVTVGEEAKGTLKGKNNQERNGWWERERLKRETENIFKRGLTLLLWLGWSLKISLIKKSTKSLRKNWQEILAIFLLFSIISLSFFWYRPNFSRAATYVWTQTDWSGGESSSFASHPDDQTGWTKYSSKGESIFAGSELTLVSSSGEIIQSSDSDFEGGSFFNTAIVGSGEGASIVLDNYQYRRPISISNSTPSDLTNYQILVTLDTASLISNGKMRSDCGDIRFRDSTNQDLSYWLESGCNTTSTKIWVKVPLILGNSSTTIYLYYGNPNATSKSNKEEVFELFDDFEDGTMGNLGVVSSGCIDMTVADDSILDGKALKMDSTSYGCGATLLEKSGKILKDGEIKEDFYFSTEYAHQIRLYLRYLDGGNYYFSLIRNYPDKIMGIYKVVGGTTTELAATSISISYGVRYTHIFRVWNNNLYTAWYDTSGNLLAEVSTTDPDITEAGRFGIGISTQENSGSDGRDNIIARKYISPEPIAIVKEEESSLSMEGFFTSSQITLGQNLNFTTLSWDATSSAGTSIKFQFSSSIDGNNWTGFVGPDGSSQTYYTNPGTQIWSGHNGARYIKYKAYLTSSNNSPTPYLNSVSIGYFSYHSWLYSRPISISNSTPSDLTNYQILVTLDTASLISNGKMRSDCGDIRFRDSTNQDLSYWLESGCNTTSTKIWVKVPLIPGSSSTTIYLYYGNPNATSESNGEETFIFFDDFEGVGLDAGKWTSEVEQGCSVNIANGEVCLRSIPPGSNPQSARLITVDEFSLPCVVGVKFALVTVRNDSTRRGIFRIAQIQDDSDSLSYYNGNPSSDMYNHYAVRFGALSGDDYHPDGEDIISDLDLASSEKEYHVAEYQWASGDIKYWRDKRLIGISNQIFSLKTGKMKFVANAWDQGNDISLYIDWIFVRKYTSLVPEVAIGSEKSALSITSSPYNTSDSDNTLSAIRWIESLPSPSTTIKLQARTSPDGSNWTSWMGINGTSTYFSSSCSECSTSTVSEGVEVTCDVPSELPIGDGKDDQWVQYKVYLETSDTSKTPSLKEVSLVYGVNSPPEFSTSSLPSVNVASSTQVEISYSVRDIDTKLASLENRGKVWPSFEYSLDGGSNWIKIPTSSLIGPRDDIPVILSTTSPESFVSTSTIWNAKQTNSNIYSTSTYIRITIDDHEKVHNTTSTIVGPFVLDTKDPTLGPPPVSIDASQEPALISFSANDDSDLYMKFSTSPDLSGLSWQPYTSTTQIDFQSDPASIYVQFKDSFGNISNIISATTPEVPSAVMVQDTSNVKVSPPEYRLFIAWKKVAPPPTASFKQYDVFRSDDGGLTYSKIGEVADIDTNCYADDTVSSDKIYYYKVATEDENGNISFLSPAVYGKANGTQDAGEGGGGTDTTPPVISNVATSSITTNSVTITWETDELSNSTVGYSTTPGDFTNEVGVATMVNNSSGVGQHSVTLTGLTPNTTYYFQVKSTDPSGNTATSTPNPNGYTFTTLPGPVIVQGSVAVEKVTNNTAKITWRTDKNSNSYIAFATSTSILEGSPLAQGTNSLTTNHLVVLTGLTKGTKYYFYVKSTDSEGNTAYDKNVVDGVVEYYTFTTSQDTIPPVISDISSSVSTSTAIITWQTNELANSRVDYGTTTNYGNFVSSSNFTIDHIINLSGLEPSTTYHYRVVSTDVNNNTATSTDNTFTTQALAQASGDNTPPTITNVAVSSVNLTSAVITWNTDENSNSIVDYGETTSLEQMAGNLDDSTTTHFVTLTNLKASTTYYFQVRSQDLAGNTATDNNSGDYYSFTTQKDTTPPTISNVSVSTVSDTKATITWTTNELSTSQVIYGTTDSYGSQTTEDATLTYQHSVTLTGLTKKTTYHFKVISKDRAGNQGVSSDYTFTTTDTPGIVKKEGGGIVFVEKKPDTIPPVFSDVKLEQIGYTSATISWKTNEPTDSFVEYGTTTDYEAGVFGKYETATAHLLTLSSLTPGTTYHFRVLGKDNYGNLGKSQDYTFTTLKPEISKKGFLDKVPSEEKELVKKVVNTLTKLANPYSLNSVSDVLEESARKIVLPPLIAGEYPKVEVGPDWAQITWITDKKSNSLVAYAPEDKFHPEKKEPYSMISGNPDEMVTTHIVKLIDLKPSTLYHFQVRSKAKIGDWAKSRDKTFKTLSLLPEISEVKFISIEDSEVKISWLTNVPTKSRIEINNVKTGKKTYIEDQNFLMEHKATIKGLQVATDYTLQITAIDDKNNQAVSSIIPFSTSVSKTPPVISNVRISTVLIPGNIERVQAIVTWKTDKPATSRLFYQEGVSIKKELTLKTRMDKRLVLNHVVILTSLKPGRVYQFRVESIDASNNRSLSRPYTVLAPYPKQNVVDLIIRNFEETFGFLKSLGF